MVTKALQDALDLISALTVDDDNRAEVQNLLSEIRFAAGIKWMKSELTVQPVEVQPDADIPQQKPTRKNPQRLPIDWEGTADSAGKNHPGVSQRPPSQSERDQSPAAK